MSGAEDTSVGGRAAATKRPAGDGEAGDEPTKKLSFGLGKPLSMKPLATKPQLAKKPLLAKPAAGICIKLGQPQQKAASQNSGSALKPKVGAAAAAFGGDEDEDEEEEMPPEAKMRMKNIGRDTPTSAGPNSFGKTRMGFCDSKKIYEKQLREVQDKANKQ